MEVYKKEVMSPEETFDSTVNPAVLSEEQTFLDETPEVNRSEQEVTDNTIEAPGDSVTCKTASKSGYLDHGYAWVILGSSVLFNLCQGLSQFAFSVLYVELTEEFQAGKGSVGLISSAQSISAAVTCLFAGIFIDSFGCHIMGVFSSFLIAIGYIVSFLSPNYPTLVTFFGVLGGIGLGFGNNVGLIVAQHWFEKHRALAGGISQIGTVVGGMIGATLITWFIETYGWKGTMLLMAGIELHGIVFALLFRPPPIAIQDKEGASLYQKVKETLNSLKDVSLFKSINFHILASVWFLTGIGVYTFYGHLPGYCFHCGLSKEQSAIPLTVASAVVIPAIFMIGFLGDKKWIDRLSLMGFGMLCPGLILVFFPLANTFWSILMMASFFSIGYSCSATLRTTTIVDLMGLKLAAKTQSFVLTVFYIASVIAVPLAGWIYDQTGSYNIPFPLAGGCQVAAGLILVMVLLYKSKCKRVI